MCLNAGITGHNHIVKSYLCPTSLYTTLTGARPIDWQRKKLCLERLESLQCHSFKMVYNVAISHDRCSLPVNPPPPSKANRKIHRRAGCSAGRPTGATAGGLPWLPAGCLQEPNQTATICHFVAVKVKRLTQQQTVTNNFCKATSNQPVSMRKTWTKPQQITATYFNKFSHMVLDYQWIKCKTDNSTAFADHVVKIPDIHTNCLWCWNPHQSHNWLDLRQCNKENYNSSLTS